ncbi:uncharacterized protein LOC126680759 [Mercurialis annua]|uniref:uncharacterized protein LOC126680759 n=1 Tax=Mercurialis annua TaxID=3986 RepID=UPI00215E63C8|nr:uncharacterized protein LOC126680759 [Mercurialis annua]
MITLCWNVQGMGSPRTFKSLSEHVNKIKPNIVFLMETRSTTAKMELFRQKLNMASCFSIDCEGKSGGLALLWQCTGSVSIKSYSKFHIDCLIEEKNVLWRFTGIYGNPIASQRVHTWTLLNRLNDLYDVPWLVGGDFNEILCQEEKVGGLLKPQYLMNNFKEALESCNLKDSGDVTLGFSWWCKRGDTIIKERLDRFVHNLNWQLCFPNYCCYHLQFGGSDHCPIVMMNSTRRNKDGHKRRRNTRFHFEEVWCKKADFHEFVREVWDSGGEMSSPCLLPTRLKNCAQAFGRWGKKQFGDLQDSIVIKKNKLNALLASNDLVPVEQIKSVESELNDLLWQEEVAWRQRSRVSWLAHGDKNTKFFHRKASARLKRNAIEGLFNKDGVWKDDEKGMEAVIQDYFSELFKSSNPSEEDLEKVLKHVSPTVSRESNSMLCSSFTKNDITQALKEMSPTKAPGEDGFPALFYQRYWQIIGEDISKVCLQILNNNALISPVNATIIALIPKVKKCVNMSSFRPISLCNVIYKIVSKTLANRLRRVLNEVIDVSQSAFIPGRQIVDNALLGFECVHYIKNSKSKFKNHLALKLDMSKAFDRVEWFFVEAMMLKLGFSSVWVCKIMNCLSSTSFSFLLNGSVKGNITPSRGLRQGDPLSPYLFIICAQGLSALINNAVVNKALHGINFGGSCPQISHLFFADDSLLFCRASLKECSAIKEILLTYGKASGQLINFDKSALSFGKCTQDRTVNEIKNFLQIPVVQCHEKYLGLPSTVGKNRAESFKSIKEKVYQKLQMWKDKLFSCGGKEILIKAVVQSIPAYSMNCFKLPKSLIAELERICARFWWGTSAKSRKIHWARWSVLCKPKCQGGMGFRDLEAFNRSILAKQLWKIITCPDSLLAKVYKQRYFKDTSPMEATVPRNASFTWKSIMWAKDIIENGCRWRIGDGVSVQIYKDRWLPREKSFKVISPPKPHSPIWVSDLIGTDGRWKMDTIRELFFPGDADQIINMPLPRTPQVDILRWHYDKKGLYTVRSGYRMAMTMEDHPTSSNSDTFSSWWKFLWALSIPSKIKIFLMKCYNGWLPVKLNLLKRGMQIDEMCPVCSKCAESTLHSLWLCPAAKDIWKSWALYCHIKPHISMNLQEWFLQVRNSIKKEDFMIFSVVLWLIWNNRNGILFGNHVKPAHQVLQWASALVTDFANARAEEMNLCSFGSSGLRKDMDDRWVPPRAGLYCVNVDAAFGKGNGGVGTGVIIRDWLGNVKASATYKHEQNVEVCLGEAIAICDGITLAKEANLTPFEVRSDAKVVVDYFNISDLPCNDVSLVVQDCLTLMADNCCVGISFSSRKSNSVAHYLARLALTTHSSYSVWWSSVPPQIYQYVLADLTAFY